ncbi:unnamed protein product [Pedinophyceae sp. YPF-701]|nr:unnamed protein product [Pedinophyceae sp. YPF-701]
MGLLGMFKRKKAVPDGARRNPLPANCAGGPENAAPGPAAPLRTGLDAAQQAHAPVMGGRSFNTPKGTEAELHDTAKTIHDRNSGTGTTLTFPGEGVSGSGHGSRGGVPRGQLVRCEATPERGRRVRSSQVKWWIVGPDCPDDVARADWSVHQFTPVKKIGKGAKSRVWHAVEKSLGRTVVLKVYDLRQMHATEVEQLEREAEIHAQLSHPNVLQLWAAFQDQVACYFLLESADQDLYHMYPRISQTDERVMVQNVIFPTVDALAYCHSKGVLHRDIKPENLIFGKDGRIRLADFGFAIDVHERRPVTRLGTLEFMAPEVIACGRRPDGTVAHRDKRTPYGAPADVWSVGVIAYELFARRTPFVGSTKDETSKRIELGEVSYPTWASTPAVDFMRRCIALDVTKRAPMRALLSHAWVTRHVSKDAITEANRRLMAAQLSASPVRPQTTSAHGPASQALSRACMKQRAESLTLPALTNNVDAGGVSKAVLPVDRRQTSPLKIPQAPRVRRATIAAAGSQPLHSSAQEEDRRHYMAPRRTDVQQDHFTPGPRAGAATSMTANLPSRLSRVSSAVGAQRPDLATSPTHHSARTLDASGRGAATAQNSWSLRGGHSVSGEGLQHIPEYGIAGRSGLEVVQEGCDVPVPSGTIWEEEGKSLTPHRAASLQPLRRVAEQSLRAATASSGLYPQSPGSERSSTAPSVNGFATSESLVSRVASDTHGEHPAGPVRHRVVSQAVDGKA